MTMTPLDGWENFYVIVGSSAGALIGLQFVVLTLISGRPVTGGEAQAGEAFSTPSVVNFGVVLLLSAVLSAPWQGVGVVAIVCGLVGLGGIAYSVVVARRMRAQTLYQPVLYDWVFYVMLPLAAYATLAGSAFAARLSARASLFLVAAAALLLLFVGINNAWDTVTHLVFVGREGKRRG
ncbi:MAG: hypothetical protein LC746_08280 [Acidobacteria bacterium]|nr:hypothetical protein [Acidobacteriota bacterium]